MQAGGMAPAGVVVIGAAASRDPPFRSVRLTINQLIKFDHQISRQIPREKKDLQILARGPRMAR